MPSLFKFGAASLALIVLFTKLALAQNLQPLVDMATPVIDQVHLLSPEELSQLNQKLIDFSNQKGSQIGIVILPTTTPEALEQYSIRLAEHLKLGREKYDDGVLILIALNDRKIRIDVGYGLEGAIPDVTAKRIIRDVISPAFRDKNYYQGLEQASSLIMKAILGEALPLPADTSKPFSAFRPWAILLMALGLLLSLMEAFPKFIRAPLVTTLGAVGGAFLVPAFVIPGLMVGLFFGFLLGVVGIRHLFTTAGNVYIASSGFRGSGGFGGGFGSGGGGFGGGGGGGFGGGGASGGW